MKQIQKSKVRFKSTDGSRISDNQAEIYGKYILNLMKVRSVRMVTASDILKDAQKKSAPYHDWFNWDNNLAAEEYRLAQARQLLRSIVEVKVIHEEQEPVEVRVFVNVIDDDGERGYVQSEYALGNPKLAPQIIQQALREAKSWMKKYQTYEELSKITKAIVDTSDDLEI